MSEAVRDAFVAWVRACMDATGLDATNLARAAGLSSTTLTRPLNNPGFESVPRVDTILRLAQVRRTPPLPALLADHVASPRPVRSEVSPAPDHPPPSVDRMPANVPVHGTAVGGDAGDFRLNGSVVDWARRPPGIAHLKDAWCVYVQSDSMSPWREPGELVYLHPSRPPRPGDYVVVELHDDHGEPGPAYLKKLVARTGTRVRLAQWNPRRDDIEIDLALVKNIYRVIDWSELLGV